MRIKTIASLIIFLLNTLSLSLFAQSSTQHISPTWESINQRNYPQWFKDAKLGIFVHWGLYSIPAYAGPDAYSEWFYRGLMQGDSIRVSEIKTIESNWGGILGNQWDGRLLNPTGSNNSRPRVTDLYTLLAPLWHAEHWNPDNWAELFAQSGAKYVVLVTKHHDGYCLWNSRYQPNWNSFTTGPHRDIVGELTQSVRHAGLRMGFYYSLTEWTNRMHVWMVDPDSAIGDYVKYYMIPQFKELVSKYKPSLIFADGEWQNSADQFHATELISWYYNTVGPDAIVNDRWGAGTQHGFRTPEYKGAIADTVRPWAECRGIGHSFALNRNEPLSNYLTSDSLIRHFVRLVAAGGGLTLNVGPDADGTIPMLQQERLLDLGKWLQVNGEAIYASHPYDKFCEPDSATFYTRQGGKTYAIALHVPDGRVVLTNAPRPSFGSKIYLLGYNKPLGYTYFAGRLTIFTGSIPVADLMRLAPAWTFRIE